MSHFRRRCAAVLAIAAVALFHLGCGDGVGLPDEGVPSEIKAFSGDDQTGPAGGTLALPVVVRVTDRSGRPVANQNVAFAPASGSGSVTPASATTDNQGKASTAWTLGPEAGAQSLTARAQGGSAPEGLDVGLTAHAVSGAATQIEIASGNEQTGSVSSALPDSLVVRVIDAGGNPVAGIEVHWSVPASGGGSISPEVVVTGEDGLAAAERVLGASAGDQSAQATAPGLEGSPLTFIQTAVPATPSLLKKVSGDGQSAPAGFQLADSLVVQLVDQNGNGVGGRAVTWVVGNGEGSVDPVNSTTTPQGFAVTRWTMPAATGTYSIDAVFSGVNPVAFTGTATSDVPTKIELVSGDHQSASVGAQLPAPLRVKVTDGNGNPVENVAVTWTATGGTVGATSTGTDASGIAEVTRTLGLTPGSYTTTAEVEGLDGSPITFTSTATAGPAAKLAILTQPSSSGQSGVPLETQPVVQLQDAFGNDVVPPSPLAITAGVTGGSVTGGTASTDGTGKATFSALAIVGSAGQSFAVTFSSGLLVPVTSDPVTLSAGNANKIVFLTTPPTAAQAGVVWVQHPVVQLEDAGGNPLAIPDVNIVVNIQTGGGTLNGTKTVATDGNGQAEFADLSISGQVGSRSVRFRNPALPASAAITANVNVVAGPAVKISAASDVSQNGSVNTAVAEPPAVLVEDAFDNPVAGTAVTFAVTAGSGTIAPTSPVTSGADGVAALTSWTLGPNQGPNTVTATAAGLTGSPVTFNASVAAINTSTQISASPTSSVVGESVDFTVQVGSGSGTPTGSVTLKVDGVDQAPKALTAGQAVFTVSFSSPGSHPVVATYAGEGAFGGSSDNANYAVDKAETSVSVGSDHAGLTPPEGESIQFTATLSVTAPGAGAPTGSVQFKDNGTNLGAPVALTGGSAILNTTDLLQGSHSITAEYLGDANFEGSTSGAISQDVGAPPDSGPIGMGETYNTNEDTPLQPDPGGGVLANDSDPDGDPITAVLVSPPQHSSSFSLNPNGSFTYQPSADYNGPDAFTYRVAANGKTTGDLTASITVAPVNDPPVAGSDDAGASLVGSTVSQTAPGVLGNDSDVDGDGLTAVLDQNVSHGSLTLNADGSFSYAPEPGYTGPDSFQYHAFDGTAASNSVTVSFLVVLS